MRREFGSALAETAVPLIVRPRQRRRGRPQHLRGHRRTWAEQARRDRLDHRGPLLHDRLALVPPRVTDRDQQLGELLAREVGPADEGRAVRRREDGHRPAALTRHRLRGRHVDRVHVGALLAVHLDRDVARVHQRGDALVLERLVRHHVTPVAGRVADGDQHRHVTALGLGERLLAPRPPVDRIVGVLQEVGRSCTTESIHQITLPHCDRRLRTAAASEPGAPWPHPSSTRAAWA